jgi:plasmid stability protein
MEAAMTNTDPSPVTQWRKRRQRQGFVRVEVQVRKEDAGLVRDVATALGDPAREAETRAILRERIATPRGGGLKALLAAAPLEGIDLDRPRDFGRDVSL